jgi:hypothetical protein
MERTVALIDLDDDDSYAVDVFRLTGGTDHYWSFHGPRSEGEAVLAGLEPRKQEKGTLAGPDVPYGQGGDWVKRNPQLGAFPYLYEVARARSDSKWSLDWALEEYPDIHVRMTSLPSWNTEVNLAKGKPPGGGNPYELQWAITHTSGDAPHRSDSVDVIEVFEGRRSVSDVRRIAATNSDECDFPAVAVEVLRGNRSDTVICGGDARRSEAAGVVTDGDFAVWSETNGALGGAYLVGGQLLKKGDLGIEAEASEWRGQIRSVDYGNRKLTVEPGAPFPAALVGRYVRIANDSSDCTHLIKAAENLGGSCQLTLALDPRICEGPVVDVAKNAVTSGVSLHLTGLRYCHGKTLTNDDGSAVYRVSGVTGRQTVWIDPEKHGNVSAEKLAGQFDDRDGDGIKRLVIYDYGVGDEVSVPMFVSLQRKSSGEWNIETTGKICLTLPGQECVTIEPGQSDPFGGSSAGGLPARPQ